MVNKRKENDMNVLSTILLAIIAGATLACGMLLDDIKQILKDKKGE